MAEQRHEVKVFEVEYHCDQCKEGVVRYTGIENIYPPIHEHMCNKCGNIQYIGTVYPCIRYERKNVLDAELQRITAERLARITPETKFLTHEEVFNKYE